MERELKLYRITETGAIVPFPNEVDDAQISITTFTYNAQRMAATPTITATVNYPRCLDNDWDVNVYAEYNGEKYYIRQIPSSSKDNTSVMYRHDITLYSERFILENIYLRDVDKNDDTNVIILVDLKDFIEVVNKSLTKSDVEYRIRPLEERELDAIEGSRDAKEIVFDKVYVATAIQEIYNQWNAPFYFQGKEIIIGDNTNFITPPFEYGAENSLLKIQKQNANFRKITKISGVGSDKNIPFYYPNWSQKGIIDAEPLGSNSGVLKKEMITVTDMKKFEKFMPLGDNNSVKYKSIDETQPINNGDTTSPQYKLKYINSTKIYQEFCVPFKSVRKDNSSIDIKFDVILREIMYPTKQDVKYNNIDPNVIAQSLYSPLSFSSSYIQHTQYPGFIHLQSTENSYIMNATQSDGVVYIDRRINVSLTNVGEIPEGDLLLSIVGTFTINNAIAKQEIIGTYKHYWSSGFGSSRKDYPASINEEKNKIILQITNLTFQYVTGDNTEGWYLNDTKKIELSDIGISISGTPNSTWNGEGFYQKYIDKIPTSQNLMLPLYRDSWGKRKFYKSINYPIQSTEYVDKEIGDYKGVTGIQNDAYKKEDNNYYIFETEYNDINPIEHIQEFSEIYPSIEGIINNSGQLFGEILEVAFDDNDNNEVDEEGKLIHPYFYIRIPKFDGSNGFNLFDHKIVGDNMQIAMTSGDCSACTFEIMVKTKENATEKSYEDVINPILTKDDGSLISGNWEEKTNGDFSNFIETQQNSKENSIWLILEKDTETFNEIYPNTIDNEEKSKVIPKVGDKFVLLNIDMPKQYVLAAEEKLRAETIKFLSQNNSDKWNFSIDFSRIFLAENETIFNQLNENAKLQVTYNGATYPFYVNSYTYEVKENEALPKITVNLSEELTINRGFAQNIADGIKRELGIVDGNIVFATIVDDDEMDKKYMRKDTSDNNPNDFTFEKNVTIEGKLSAPTIESSTIQSQKYSGDSVIGSGYKLYEDENGESTLHIDNIDVRKKLKTTEFIIQQIQFQGGIVIQSAAAMECNKVETLSNGNFKCYFDTKEGSVSNQFMLNDLARCQRVGYAPKYYWRKVVEVGNDYIVLSNVTGEYEQNSDTPSEGDIIVQMGNTTNTDRQSVIEMNTVGENSPSFIMYSGINSFSLLEKDVTGIVYHQKVFDENGNVSIEAYPELYSYGSMYFGDRNKQDNFIQFAPNANGTFEMLINAKTSFQGGTSDLGNALDSLLSGVNSAQSTANSADSKATQAQTTADGKSTTFIVQPSNYGVGDLWILASNTTVNNISYKAGTILTANQASATFVASHWSEKVKYTDDTAVNNMQIGGVNLVAFNDIMLWNGTQVRNRPNITITANSSYQGGVYIPASYIQLNTEYVLSFKIKKTSGSITKIGGHHGTGTSEVYIDGVKMPNAWNSSNTITNDTNEHYIVVKFKQTASASDNQLYIQPNRNNYTNAFTCIFSDIQLEQGTKATSYKPNDADVIEARTNILKDGMLSAFYSSITRTLTTSLKTNTEYVFSVERSTASSNLEVRVGSSSGTKLCSLTTKTDSASYVTFTTPSSLSSTTTIVILHATSLGVGNTVSFVGLKLAEGNKYVGYEATPNEKDAIMTLQKAMKGSTEIVGGLVMTNLIEMKNEDNEITAGISGLSSNQSYTENNASGTFNSSLRFWAGSNLQGSNTAPFRVYDNGEVYGGNFFGLNGAFEINANNIFDVCDYQIVSSYICLFHFRFDLTGSHIFINNLSSISLPNGATTIQFQLPLNVNYFGAIVKIYNPNKYVLMYNAEALLPKATCNIENYASATDKSSITSFSDGIISSGTTYFNWSIIRSTAYTYRPSYTEIIALPIKIASGKRIPSKLIKYKKYGSTSLNATDGSYISTSECIFMRWIIVDENNN